jgi:5-methylcytosine-specific restriction endonuclease McrA
MENLKTLVLRKDYQPFSLFPISSISARDAVTRCIAGSCEIVSCYDIRIKTANPDLIMYWPSVIRSLDPKVKQLRSTPILDKEPLYYRDHAECSYCGKGLRVDEITMDHVVPESKGGLRTWDNIVAACNDCNSRKGNLPAISKWTPRRLPYTPTTWDLVKIRKNYPIIIPHESWLPWLGDWKGGIQIKEAA